MNATDLFCGMGGLAYGFARQGFPVVGVDLLPIAEGIFEENRLGRFLLKDLRTGRAELKCDVLLGGPPCRPWSNLNVTRRAKKHPDYCLLDSFFRHVANLEPRVFLMENVASLQYDAQFTYALRRTRRRGYSISYRVVRYSDWGAATARHRLVVFGMKDGGSGSEEFFRCLELEKRPAKTAAQALSRFERVELASFPDHVWPRLKTIRKYRQLYQTGKFGWYQLSYNRPAPSFGNVMKTYILHPLAGRDGFPLRVISIREAMALMGFPDGFHFPDGMGIVRRYQMIADAVSPVFSRACANVVSNMMEGLVE